MGRRRRAAAGGPEAAAPRGTVAGMLQAQARRCAALALAGVMTAVSGCAGGTATPSRGAAAPAAPASAPRTAREAAGSGATAAATPVREASATVQLLPDEPLALNAVAMPTGGDAWVAGSGAIFATTDGGATWHRQYRGGATVASLDALDAAHVWAVADNALLRTADGGAVWSPAGEPAGQPLQAVEFVSPTAGFGVTRGNPDAVVETSDGGSTWQPVAAPVAGYVWSLCFTSAEDGWLLTTTSPAGSGVQVEATSDGGSSWRTAFAPQGLYPVRGGELACVPGGAVWLLLNAGASMMQMAYGVFRSAGGGPFTPVAGGNTAGSALWTTPPAGLTAPIPGYFAHLAATGPDTAFLIGDCAPCDGAGVVHTAATGDGGTSWQTTQVSGLPSADDKVAFGDATHGLLVGRDLQNQPVVLRTTDGGATWQASFEHPDPAPTTALSFPTSTVGYGLGSLQSPSAVLRSADGGATWTTVGHVPAGPDSSYAQLAANGGHDLLAFTDAEHGFAVTPDGYLVGTVDGGRDWTRLTPGGTATGFEGVAFVDGAHGCAQAAGVLLATTDGGATWTPLPAAEASAIEGGTVQGRDAAVLCAQAVANPAWLTRPLSATPAPPSAARSLAGAHGPGTRWVWWSGGTFGLMMTSDGGRSWTRVTLPPTVNTGLIAFANGEDAWLLTQNDHRVLRTTDGGLDWAQVA